jgi:hypothetical protein
MHTVERNESRDSLTAARWRGVAEAVAQRPVLQEEPMTAFARSLG